MTTQESPPSRDRFKAACRAEFAFLVSDYGFTELPPEPTPYADPFKVRFVRDDLEVIIQGINYGQNVITTIQDGQRQGHLAVVPPPRLCTLHQPHPEGQWAT